MHPNVLVIAVDGLRASALGAYGNTTFPTPALDRLAAESLLVEWCYAPSPDVHDVYGTLWNSRHPGKGANTQSLARMFGQAGYTTKFVTDDASLAALAAAADFNEITQVEGEHSLRTLKQPDAAETEMARTFLAGMDRLSTSAGDQPRLLWLHTRGMYGAWDAPVELQLSLLDEEDVAPITSANPPDFVVGDKDDPDLAFRYACAYAAQVMLLDECVGNVLETLASAEGAWIVSLVGIRGFPLGEHGRIGGTDARMYGEQLHVPWSVRLPDQRGRLARVGALASHGDLLPTLAETTGSAGGIDPRSIGGHSVARFATSGRASLRHNIISASASARSIRTASWCLREDVAGGGRDHASNGVATVSELFVRPDDRWEANDVAKLCPDVVEELRNQFGSC
jgi:arylsulfatase A-like enzyme